MKYQKIANLLNDGSNKPPRFITRNWVKINDEARGTYSHNKQIKFKTSMLRSSLCDYSDADILVKRNITVNNTAAGGTDANNTNKKVIFENCAPLTNCISKINNTQIDNAEYIDIVMPMYNLIVIHATDSFNFKTKITGQTNNNGIINVEIMVALKYLTNFWRTLEMPLINCEVELFFDMVCKLYYNSYKC